MKKLEEILKQESVDFDDVQILSKNLDLLSEEDKKRFGFIVETTDEIIKEESEVEETTEDEVEEEKPKRKINK